MAVTFAPESGVTRTAHGYAILPENLVIQPELSGRSEATDVSMLAKDIRANGQINPVTCWKNDAGYPVLCAGHRRWRAISLINESLPLEERIRIQFNYVPAKDALSAFDFSVRENLNRENPTMLDTAWNMGVYLTKFGLSEEEIARKYYPGIQNQEDLDKAIREVKNHLALLELSPAAKEEFKKSYLSTTAAVQLAALPRMKQDEIIQKAKEEGEKRVKVKHVQSAAGTLPTRANKFHSLELLSETAGSLAAAVIINKDYDHAIKLSEEILIVCEKLKVPLPAPAKELAEKLLQAA